MALFTAAVELVLRHEGGFVANPDDPGGATNRGVTKAVLASYRGKPVSVDDVRALSVEEARAIYLLRYWTPIRGDDIRSQDVANWCLDMAVLRGVGAAVLSLQQVLGVVQDQNVGPKTLTALNACQPAAFLNAFRSVCVKKFAQLASTRATSLQFLPGWVRRAEEVSDVVNLLLQKTSARDPAA